MVFQLQRLYLFDYILLHFYPDVAMSYLTSNFSWFFWHFQSFYGNYWSGLTGTIEIF